MTIPDMIVLAKQIAVAHGLDPALVCAVADHESCWNPWAVRYEPAFYAHYIADQTGLTVTEARARAFSYGLMQIMGQTATELGFTGTYLTELCDPAGGLEYGCRKLAKCVAAHPGPDWTKCLLAYNGGSDLQYPGLVLALMVKYEVKS